ESPRRHASGGLFRSPTCVPATAFRTPSRLATRGAVRCPRVLEGPTGCPTHDDRHLPGRPLSSFARQPQARELIAFRFPSCAALSVRALLIDATQPSSHFAKFK